MGARGDVVIVVSTVDGAAVRESTSSSVPVRCSAALLVPLSLGYITKVRSYARANERGELGKWENHTILCRLHHRAAERTSASSSTATLVS